MKAIISTGAIPYGNGSGFTVDIEINEDGKIRLDHGAVMLTFDQWDATVKAVEKARAAFLLVQENSTRPEVSP